jgi:hypothetical protein
MSSEKDVERATGIICTQCFIEPITQASLSLFHFSGKQEGKQSELSEINKIFSGDSDSLSITVDKDVFCPYNIIKINFNKISIPYIRKVTEDDIYMTAPLLIKNNVIKKNYFMRRDKVVCISLIKEKMKPQNISLFYTYYYIKELTKKFKCIPIKKDLNTDEIIIISRDDDVDACYSSVMRELYQNPPENNFLSYDFSIDEYLSSKEKYMNFHITDRNKYVLLLEIPGIIGISFCDIKKICTYYGIEVAREITKKKFLNLTPKTKFLEIILDFLTYKGVFTTGETNSIIRSIAGNEMRKDIKKYTTTFEDDSYEDDLETRMLLGRIDTLSLEGVIDK